MSIAPFTSTGHSASIEERVNDVYRALCLIHAACQADEGIVFVDHDGVLDGISMLALEAVRVLEPLRHTPHKIANWEPEPHETGVVVASKRATRGNKGGAK